MVRLERFGEFLVDKGALTREALTRLLATQRMVRERIGTLAVREGLLDEDRLTAYLSEFHGIPLFDRAAEQIEKGVAAAIPAKIALKANVLPVGSGPNGEMLLACVGPLPRSMMQTISRLAKRQVRLVLTSPRKMRRMHHLFLSRQFDTTIHLHRRVEAEETGFVVELFEKLMVRAIHQGASDIHMEPEKDALIIRLRVDGMLRQTERLPADLAPKLVSRVKVVGGMDIAERRKPQDGAFRFVPQALDLDIEGVNVRVNTLPVIHGEKAVLRLLPPHDETIDLNGLGMQPSVCRAFTDHLRLAYGIALVTGPTGSGKSTTLYGALQMLRVESSNITTIEDPVELTVSGVNQTQVDSGDKISFASALRAILRQDPDIIMVGEIRDGETLSIALRAAITGHLVLSTLHTNDASSAFGRMIDMGAETYLVAAAVRAVLAQRLVRRVCTDCGRWQALTRAEMEALGTEAPYEIRRGDGCSHCHAGYRGRQGIFEFLSVDDDLRQSILEYAAPDALRRFVLGREGFVSLREDGLKKVRDGITTPEEIMRVTLD